MREVDIFSCNQSNSLSTIHFNCTVKTQKDLLHREDISEHLFLNKFVALQKNYPGDLVDSPSLSISFFLWVSSFWFHTKHSERSNLVQFSCHKRWQFPLDLLTLDWEDGSGYPGSCWILGEWRSRFIIKVTFIQRRHFKRYCFPKGNGSWQHNKGTAAVYVITSTKQVMFMPAFICLFVC